MDIANLLSPSCALFLDFDGTLVDLAPQPEAVVVPASLVSLLARLSERLGGAVAVVSGRPIVQLDHYLAPLRLPAAGEHGAERRGADHRLTHQPVAPLDHVHTAAQALAQQWPALRVEVKRAALALHYRQAPELAALCIATMEDAVARTPGLVLLQGKMVVEAKPAAIDKGQAIAAFMREAPFTGRRAVFAGDDVTDEAGFAAVQSNGGAGIKVGAGATIASHRLDGPSALHAAIGRAIDQLPTISRV